MIPQLGVKAKPQLIWKGTWTQDPSESLPRVPRGQEKGRGLLCSKGTLPGNGKEMLGSNMFSGNTDGCITCQCFPLFEGAYHATLVAHAMCIVKPHEQSEARLVKMILTVLLSL